MMKLIEDATVSMRSILYFDAINSVIEQNIKEKRRCQVKYGHKTKMKYNKWKK